VEAEKCWEVKSSTQGKWKPKGRWWDAKKKARLLGAIFSLSKGFTILLISFDKASVPVYKYPYLSASHFVGERKKYGEL